MALGVTLAVTSLGSVGNNILTPYFFTLSDGFHKFYFQNNNRKFFIILKVLCYH